MKRNRLIITAGIAALLLAAAGCGKIAETRVQVKQEASEFAEKVKEEASEIRAEAESAANEVKKSVETVFGSTAGTSETGVKAEALQPDGAAEKTGAAAPDSFYESFGMELERDSYEADGTLAIGKGGAELLLTELTVSEDRVISVQGETERIQGALELIYRAQDGSETSLLKRTAEDSRRELEFLSEFTAKAGEGALLFKGDGSRYEFELEFRNWPREDMR